MKFSELNLPANMMSALKKMKFETLTPIQEVTYPIIASGKDLCALAETGSGKTVACAIPLIEKIDEPRHVIQAIVIVPTRELCLQYMDEMEKVAADTGIVVCSIYGGEQKSLQLEALQRKAHILVGTPGRVIDFLYDGAMDFSHVKCAILDEADELLKEGFLKDVQFILSCVTRKHQTLLFSATMADDIKKLAHDCLHEPEHISLISKRAVPKSIEHSFCYLNPKFKQQELVKYLEDQNVVQAIIFCNARHLVDKLFHTLKRSFKRVEYTHAGLVQNKRTSIFDRFKKQRVQYLIATDVAGRGLDFSHVSHVINWNFPLGEEQYTHRTGRTGRMGKKGKAMTFIIKHELSTLRKFLRAKKIVPQWIGQDPFDENTKPQKKTSKGC